MTPRYTGAQTETLKKLRSRFFEKGFLIFPVKKRYAKHPDEFVAAKPDESNFDSAIVRLYFGKVRIQFFEVAHPLSHTTREHISRGLPLLVWSSSYRNDGACRFSRRYWHEFAYKKDIRASMRVR